MKRQQIRGLEASTELSGFVGDPRLARRSASLVSEWQESPGLGFPEVYDDAELEALYRFLSNGRIEFESLHAPHAAATASRCALHREVLVIHDTSTFVFEGERKGLGFINKNNRGFLGHFSIAASFDGVAAVPLGTLNVSTWIREETRSSKGVSQRKLRSTADCESHRWLESVTETQKKLKDCEAVIHVMDREGDIYDCLASMVANNTRFVTRANANRLLKSDEPEFNKLFDSLDGLPIQFRDSIQVSARAASPQPDARKRHPQRDARTANIGITSTTVTLPRPRSSGPQFPATTSLNLVHVFETHVAPNDTPVEWVLLTNEPCTSEAELRRVVAIYRKRWLVEEFFKALKTGCAYEKRQLTTFHALKNTLALALPIAWTLLMMRTLCQHSEALPAHDFVSSFRLKVIRAHATRCPLPDKPTLGDVARSIAGMGGWLKRNGPPGWQTLSHGLIHLLDFEAGWTMATNTSDQS